MLAHVFGQNTHANAGEVIDRETGMSRVIRGEETLKAWPQNLITESGLQAGQAHVLSKVLEQNLDEDTAARGGFLFVEMNHRKNMPADGIVADHVSEETSDVTQTVCLVAVNRVVVFGKCSLEQVRPQAIDLCEPLSNQAVELGVGSFLGATLDNHRRQFWLQTGGQVDLHQFVTAFFEIDTRHDRQVDGSTQID